MRAIKFRVWDGDSVRSIDLYWFEESGYEEWPSPYNKETVLMQYTGLKDKNGVEIYEGDITDKGEVHWDFGGWFIGNDYAGKIAGTERGACEVIGNIYENPELLQEAA